MPSQQQVFNSFSLEGQWVQMWWTTGPRFTYDAELTHTGWEITYLVMISVVFLIIFCENWTEIIYHVVTRLRCMAV